MALTNYTRWRSDRHGVLTADLLGVPYSIGVNPTRHTVHLDGADLLDGAELTPNEARLIGVRLIDAAVLADGDRAIRQPPERA